MINIIIGIIFLVGGFIASDNGHGVIFIGAIILGIIQIIRGIVSLASS